MLSRQDDLIKRLSSALQHVVKAQSSTDESLRAQYLSWAAKDIQLSLSSAESFSIESGKE
jgi:hypothetical protein